MSKDHKPGFRIPTAKGSIKHKSKKDYNRKKKTYICKYCKDQIENDTGICAYCNWDEDHGFGRWNE